jgi:hypothetical protein
MDATGGVLMSAPYQPDSEGARVEGDSHWSKADPFRADPEVVEIAALVHGRAGVPARTAYVRHLVFAGSESFPEMRGTRRVLSQSLNPMVVKR